MPVQAWSSKRERQYEHIKEGLEERGRPQDLAEEIAARTVNKERARAGEARDVSRTSIDDISSGRRGGSDRTAAPADAPTTSCATRRRSAASGGGRR
jgi:hypothetical protein